MGAGWQAGGPRGRGLWDANRRPAGQTDVGPQRRRHAAGMALARAWKQMSWFYYQYLLVTALYMLEPWERTVFSILPGPRARGRGGGRGLGGGGRGTPRGTACADSPLRGGHAGGRPGSGARSRGWGGGGWRPLLRSRSPGSRLTPGRSVFITGRITPRRYLTWRVLACTSAAPAFGSAPCSVGGRDRVSGANRSDSQAFDL